MFSYLGVILIQKTIVYTFKAIRELQYYIIPFISTFITKIYFKLNGVKYGSLRSIGIPMIHISLRGRFEAGQKFTMCNWIGGYATGYSGRCKIEVRNGASLIIGNSVGMSIATIICHDNIVIHDNVKLGFGVHIFDTDFHAVNYKLRNESSTDIGKTNPIIIEENVLIGAHSMILKGVTIGKNSIIGAGSIVTKDIPSDVIAAGNPCKVIKQIII
jgi:acetyltransferase-like isoleucine patch superfamily enzyme